VVRLAYLLGTYPTASMTFVRREIRAIEAAGFAIQRFAVRRWDQKLVDPDDIAEEERTTYLLSGGGGTLVGSFLRDVMSRPWAFGPALRALARLIRARRGEVIRHAAYLMQASHLRRLCVRNGVTHLHGHFSANAAAVLTLCRLLGGPAFSFTVHGPDELVDPVSSALGLKVHYAAHVVAISGYCERRIREVSDPADWHKIQVVPCGLPLAQFEPAPFRPSNVLLCVGRLCEQKGQVLIPRAVAQVRHLLPPFEVILVGDGEARGDIEREIATHGVGDIVRLVGWKTNDEVRRMLAQARALLLPSFAEGLPIAIMEAYAMGRPVISTRIAGIPELVDGDCGILFDPSDPAGLPEALKAIFAMSDTQLQDMAAEGRRRVQARHDLDVSAARLITLFGGDRDDSSGPAQCAPIEVVTA
jgi:colanic acid/amylovoran biosynthesis glycosyltransferase